MMMRSRRFGAGLFLGVCLLLSACGGGSNDSEAPPEPTALPASVAITSGASVEAGTPVQFTSDVADPPAGLQFQWDFGDGASSAEVSPSHGFASPGQYEVTLTLTNEAGEARSAALAVSVRRYSNVQGLICSAADAGWCWQNPRPTGNSLQDIQFVDAQTGWAVGEAGQILQTVDGGLTWSNQPSPVDTDLTTVRFASKTVGWAAGLSTSEVLKTEDGGQTWTRQATGSGGYDDGTGLKLVVLDEQRALATRDYYSSSYTLDGGQTWLASSMRPDQVTPDGTLWHADYYTLSKAANLGAEQPVTAFDGYFDVGYLTRFSMGSGTTGLLVIASYSDQKDELRRTTDSGATWQVLAATGLPGRIDYLQLYGSSEAWAVSNDGLYRSADGGLKWTSIVLPSDVSALYGYDVAAADGSTLWFRHGGGYYVTTDAGRSWTMFRSEGEYSSPSKLAYTQGGWWLTYADRIYHSGDNGAHWTQSFGGTPDEGSARLTDVWFFDGHRGLATADGGWLMETTDGGRQWTRKSLTGQPSYVRGRLQFESPALGWMSGDWGVSKSTDGGASWWVPVSDSRMNGIGDFHFVDAHNGWALTQNNDIFRSTDGGDSWTWLVNLPAVRALRFIDSQTGVALSWSGRTYRTTDGGATWSQRPSGTYRSLERVVFTDANTGWAVGEYGAVVVSHDAGLSWTEVAVPAGVDLHDVRFADALHGWIVGDHGLVLATADGGESWSVQASGTTDALFGAFFLDVYTGWIVGAGSTVIATATGGR
jgi:photosystem II stability/assembly factor-like uncharacterized protein